MDRIEITSSSSSSGVASRSCRTVRIENTSVHWCALGIRFLAKKGKVKLSLCLTHLRHEGVWGSGCVDPHFLDLGSSWRWVVSFTPRPLHRRGRTSRFSLDRRLGGPQNRSWRLGDETVVLPVASRYTDCAIAAPSNRSTCYNTFCAKYTFFHNVHISGDK
jgi:hypothetical protein